jgi:hypothetical protein
MGKSKSGFGDRFLGPLNTNGHSQIAPVLLVYPEPGSPLTYCRTVVALVFSFHPPQNQAPLM